MSRKLRTYLATLKHSLDREEIELVSNVITEACSRLGECDQSMKDKIASRVVSSADRGERDYHTLLSIALAEFPRPS